jgi:hypothetical protein
MDIHYFLADGPQKCGPFTVDQLSAAGLTADTLVWHAGMARWERADRVPELAAVLITLPPPVPSEPAVPPPPPGPDAARRAAWEEIRHLGRAMTWLQLAAGLFAVFWLTETFQRWWVAFVASVPLALAVASCAGALHYRRWVWAAAALIPFMNLLVALAINQAAFLRLKRAGVRAGFLRARVPASPPAGFQPPTEPPT